MSLAWSRRCPVAVARSRGCVVQDDLREDLRYWAENDGRFALRVVTLIELVMADPFAGLGKPEPLRHLGPNIWSRRLTQEHRVVYLVSRDRIDFLQARYHY